MSKIQEFKSKYQEKDGNVKLRKCKECEKIKKIEKMENSFTCIVCYVKKNHKKRCAKCKMTKPINLFYKNSGTIDGHFTKCKECIMFVQNKNKVELKKYGRDYYQSNKDGLRKKRKTYLEGKFKSDPLFKLKMNIRGLVSTSLRRGSIKTNTKARRVLGCSWETLNSHLNNTCINNYNHSMRNLSIKYTLHIDHIVPIANAKDEGDVIRLNHYKNLQILIREDCLRKSNKTTIFKVSQVSL